MKVISPSLTSCREFEPSSGNATMLNLMGENVKLFVAPTEQTSIKSPINRKYEKRHEFLFLNSIVDHH